jgi:hypothetical protein
MRWKGEKRRRYTADTLVCDTANKNIDLIIFPSCFFYFSREKGKTFSLLSPRSDFLGSGRRSNVSGEKLHSKKSFCFLALWAGWAGWIDGINYGCDERGPAPSSAAKDDSSRPLIKVAGGGGPAIKKKRTTT